MAVFIHALGTFNRVTTNNGFITSNGVGVILGGGLDVPFGKKFAWRVFGADYVWALHNFANYAPPECGAAAASRVQWRKTANRYCDELGRSAGTGSRGGLHGAADRSIGGRTDHGECHGQQFQSEAHCLLQLERQRRHGNRKRYRRQHRYQRRGSGHLHRHGARHRCESQEEQRSELLSDLHDQAAAAEESSDHELFGESVQRRYWRLRKHNLHLHQSGWRSGFRGELDFHRRLSVWKRKYGNPQHCGSLGGFSNRRRDLHRLAWFDRSGVDASHPGEPAGRQEAGNAARAAQRLLHC